MSRKEKIQNAYKYLGKEATFYDGMITCSTIPGKAVCKVVWNMDKGVPEGFNTVDLTVYGLWLVVDWYDFLVMDILLAPFDKFYQKSGISAFDKSAVFSTSRGAFGVWYWASFAHCLWG